MVMVGLGLWSEAENYEVGDNVDHDEKEQDSDLEGRKHEHDCVYRAPLTLQWWGVVSAKQKWLLLLI